MEVTLINPKNGRRLLRSGDHLADGCGGKFPVVSGVPQIAEADNYTENFGFQWNKFSKTQLDRETEGQNLSRIRFFAGTKWDAEDLSGKSVLEVGSGAGRFTNVVLRHTKGTLYSVDFSEAVFSNMKNNGHLAPERLFLFRASIYELPFADNSFDKVFCFGVLQHTPDFEASVRELIKKAKPGGEIVVDFYPIKGWWSTVNAKYMLRPITKRMSHLRLLRIIESNIGWLIGAYRIMWKMGLGLMTRFLPICDMRVAFPPTLTEAEVREWAILDTFDAFSPAHDHPQRVGNVAKMFERHGARVTFSGFVRYGNGMSAAVVRGVKRD